MEILILQIFVSLVLVGGGVLAYLVSARQRDVEHSDRLSLAPLEPDTEERHDA